MTDYVIKFSGQDNLSSTLNNIKSEIKDVGKSTTALEDISKKFQRIQNSSAPLKKQLRDLKAIMADMNMKGLAGTDQYTKIAQEAGRIKDAMDDAAAATKRFSDDTFALTAFGDAMQVIAGAGSIAAGAMSMFGVESDKVQQAILKCQQALAVLNGVQAVANKLNKDSALMQALKTIRINLATAATVTNTTATVANTAATQAWNTAKAIGKALLGDWTGLLLVGGAALAAYALTTNNAADAQEDLNKKNEEGTSIEQDAVKSASDKIAKLRTLYSITQDHTRSLKERNAAADEMRTMNPDILSGLTNEAILAGNAADAYNEMAAAIIRVAEAEAAYERIKKLTAKKLELKQRDRELNNSVNNLTQGIKGAAASQGINLQTTAANYVNPEIAKLDDEINAITTEYSEGITKLLTGKSGKGSPRTGGGRSGRGSGSSNPVKEKKELEEAKGLIGVLEKEIQDLQTQIKEATTEDLIKKLNDQLTVKQKELTELKIRVGLEDNPVDNLYSQYQELLNSSNTKIQIPVSSFEIAKNRGKATDPLEDIKAQMDSNDSMMNSLSELASQYEKIGATGAEEYQKLIDKIYELIEAQKLLGNQVQEIQEQHDIEAEKIETKKKLYEDLMSTAQSLGSGLQALGQEEAAAAVQIASATADAVSEIIPQVMALIGVKQGEALASGTASAAALPFPANIAAIAAIVAQIMAVFSTIASVAGKFAEGGIVGGSSMVGDRLIARVNSGEMILNGSQQRNLFNLLDNGGGIAGTGGQVEFKISGSTLKGVLRNYDNKMSKIR